MRRLQPNDAAPGSRDSNRAALIAAHRHVHGARGNQRGAAAGRSAARVIGIRGVEHGVRIAGVAPAREAEILADGFACDLAACVENSSDDGGVLVRRKPLEHSRAVAHWQFGHANVVFQCYRASGEFALIRRSNRTSPRPGSIRILLGRGSAPRVSIAIWTQPRSLQLIEPRIRLERLARDG